MVIVSASKCQRLFEEVPGGVNLAMLYSQNSASPNDIPASNFRGYLAHFQPLSEHFFCFGELVQAGVGNTLDRKDLDLRIPCVWSSRMGTEQRQHVRIHSSPQERFRFQNSEFPGPFRARTK